MKQKRPYRWSGIALAAFLAAAILPARAATKVFAIFGDCGEGLKTDNQCSGWATDSDQLAVRNLMNNWAPDALLTVGDNIYFRHNSTAFYFNGANRDYSVFNATEAFDIAIGQYYYSYIKYPAGSASCFVGSQSSVNRYFPVVGNHDWDWDATANGGASTLAGFTSYFDLPGSGIAVGSVASGLERYYDFVIGDAHFFMISSDPVREAYPTGDGITAPAENDGTTVPNATSQKQAKWLKDALAASTAKWKFVLFHHPPYSSTGSTVSSMRWPFRLWGADAVIDGHVHAYERIHHDSIPYITSGLGGRDIQGFGTTHSESISRYNSAFGAVKATVTDKTATFVFYNTAGQTVDSVHLVKNGGGGTVDSKVIAGSDDAEERPTDGAVDLVSSDLELVDDAGDWGNSQTIGMRFQNIAVPRYAVIKKAYIQFTPKNTGTQPGGSASTSIYFQGQASDNPSTFTTTAYSVSSRTRTTAAVNWSPSTSWSSSTDGVATPDQMTPDISSIVQELVNRTGWASGNAMAILASPGAGMRRAYSFNGTSVGAPRLHIEWELPTVTVAATDSIAREPDYGTDTGTWTITRAGNLASPLTVNYTVGAASTASSGDYSSIGTSVSFAATESAKTVTLTPINDASYEGNETVVLTLSSSTSYINGTPDGAAVTIESIRDLGVLSGDSSSRALAVSYTSRVGGYSGDSSPRAFLTEPNAAINSSTDNIDAEIESWFGNGNGSVVNSVLHSSGASYWHAVGDWVDGSGNARSFCRYRKPTASGGSSDPQLSLTLLAVPYNGTATSVRSIRYASWQSTYHGCIGYSIVNGQAECGYWAVDDIYRNSWWYGYGSYLPSGDSYGMDYFDSYAGTYVVGYWYGYDSTYSVYNTKAFVLDLASGGYFLATPYPDLASEAYNLNTSLQIVGYYMDDTVKRPALWQYLGSGSSSLTTLSMPSGYSSYHGRARSINAGGLIGGSIFPSAAPAETDQRACLWTSSTVLDLNSVLPVNSDWLLYDAQSVNDVGQVAGYGLKGGAMRAFLMTP